MGTVWTMAGSNEITAATYKHPRKQPCTTQGFMKTYRVAQLVSFIWRRAERVEEPRSIMKLVDSHTGRVKLKLG